MVQVFAWGILFPTGMVLGVGSYLYSDFARTLMRCEDNT
jgi:hypothetical protein